MRWNQERRLSVRVLIAVGVACAAYFLFWPTSVSIALHTEVDSSPERVAHGLADFSRHLHLYPHIKSWRIEEDRSKGVLWRYIVHYECGKGCDGFVRVNANLPPHPLHHSLEPPSVQVTHDHCPFLPWFLFCEQTNWLWSVIGRGERTEVRVEAWRRCGGSGLRRARCGEALARETHDMLSHSL